MAIFSFLLFFHTFPYLHWTSRRTGQFFLGGLNHLCPKNILTEPEKNANLTDQLACNERAETVYIVDSSFIQNCFARLTPPDFKHFILWME